MSLTDEIWDMMFPNGRDEDEDYTPDEFEYDDDNNE